MLLLVDPLERIQDAVNHIVQQDAPTLAAIRQLAGRIIAIEIAGPGIKLFIQFNDHGITLMKNFDGKPHVTIKARPGTFTALLLGRNAVKMKSSPDMEIIGDVLLAQEFQKIVNNINVDWEEEISRWAGDTAARKLGRVFSHSRKFFQETRKTIGMDISEYLRYEKELLPDRDEVEEFISEVDMLRNDAERIRQRVERLQERITTNIRHG